MCKCEAQSIQVDALLLQIKVLKEALGAAAKVEAVPVTTPPQPPPAGRSAHLKQRATLGVLANEVVNFDRAQLKTKRARNELLQRQRSEITLPAYFKF
jgi:hypothetical protein